MNRPVRLSEMDDLMRQVASEIDTIKPLAENPAVLAIVASAIRKEVGERQPWEPEWNGI